MQPWERVLTLEVIDLQGKGCSKLGGGKQREAGPSPNKAAREERGSWGAPHLKAYTGEDRRGKGSMDQGKWVTTGIPDKGELMGTEGWDRRVPDRRLEGKGGADRETPRGHPSP